VEKNLSKTDLLILTQILEGLDYYDENCEIIEEKRDSRNNNIKYKKKKIDEMQKFFGFFVLDYAQRIYDNGNVPVYMLPPDVAALISLYLFHERALHEVMKKIKKFIPLSETEVDSLKEAMKKRFLHILKKTEVEISDAEVKKIIDNQVSKLINLQKVVKQCISIKDEIRKEFNNVIYTELKTKKYYDANLKVELEKEKLEEKLRKIDGLKDKILREIKDFGND